MDYMENIEIIRSNIKDIKYGKRVRIISPSNLYNCKLDDDVFIGPFVEIQRNVIIGERTRVQSHCFICELVTVGKDCFIGHGVMFINDNFSNGKTAKGDKTKWKRTKIGNRVLIGSNSTLLPVNICNDVVIGAGSVVTKSITKPGKYAGNPAKLISYI